jgi:hypothetical protein
MAVSVFLSSSFREYRLGALLQAHGGHPAGLPDRALLIYCGIRHCGTESSLYAGTEDVPTLGASLSADEG